MKNDKKENKIKVNRKKRIIHKQLYNNLARMRDSMARITPTLWSNITAVVCTCPLVSSRAHAR